jgi:hypothetical protein
MLFLFRPLSLLLLGSPPEWLGLYNPAARNLSSTT